MQLLLCLFCVCHISGLLTVLNGYVLIAANIDEFKTIAKEFISENVADQLVDIATPDLMKTKENPVKLKIEYYHNTPKTNSNKNKNIHEYVEEKFDKQSGKLAVPNTEFYVDDTQKNRAKTQNNENKGKQEQEEVYKQSIKKENAIKRITLLQEYEDKQVARTVRSRIEKTAKTSATTTHQSQIPFNMDELVEKVKERLETQFEEKYIEQIIKRITTEEKQRHTTTDYNEYIGEPNVKKYVNTNAHTTTEYNKYIEEPKSVKKYVEINAKQKYWENVDYDSKKTFTRDTYIINDGNGPTKTTNKDYGGKHTIRFEKIDWKAQKSTRQQVENQYEDLINENTNNPVLFEEKHLTLTANDSYEDYVTPAKDNIFQSKERVYEKSTVENRSYKKSADFKRTTRSVNIKPSYPNDGTMKQSEKKFNYYVYGNTPGDYKAKTDHLSYDYIMTVIHGLGNTVKVKKITNIPTKQHYKMTSPNYLAKIPVRAEKYDFEESLPENDREIEVKKHFINPSARINGRVVLRNEMVHD